MSNFQELTDEVIQHQFSPTQYTAYLQGNLGTGGTRSGILNQGLRYICAQTDFQELETFLPMSWAADEPYMDLPDDFHHLGYIVRVDSNKNVPLKRLSDAVYDAQVFGSGVPSSYKIATNKLSLYPTPSTNTTIGLNYWAIPPLLSAKTDVPVIPEQYHYLMVHYALKHCYERENDYTSAQYHWGMFEQGIMKCRGEVHNAANDESQPRIVGDDSVDAFLAEGF